MATSIRLVCTSHQLGNIKLSRNDRRLALHVGVGELEQEFRQQWQSYDPTTYDSFLNRVAVEERLELLTRLLSVEIEYDFQPPERTTEETEAVTKNLADEEDERACPRVQLFLLRYPELLSRQDLILRLVVLEYALRLRHDPAPPNPDSYLSLCPGMEDRLSKLLSLTDKKLISGRPLESEPAEVGCSDSTVKDNDSSNLIGLEPLPTNLGCFLLIRMIGRGGMGLVHAGIDLRSTAQVAVKVMRRMDAWSVYRFIEEFRWLSQLNHPSLVKLYDAFSDRDLRYFSMEYIEGQSIRTWFRELPSDETRWAALSNVLSELASAVQYLHDHGGLHRDIKSSNVMITNRGRAVLLDLGLAVRASQAALDLVHCGEDRLVGTLQYMAPECLLGRPSTRASDWYSFGVTLYETITDSYPPVEVDMHADEDNRYRLDRQQLLSSLADCPAELAELCAALLQSEPEARPDGPTILRRLGWSGNTSTSIRLTKQFLERDTLLNRIEETAHQIRGQQGAHMLIHGESGSGKTTVLHHLVPRLREQGYWVAAIRCYRQDHTPLRLLNMMVQELIQLLGNLPKAKWREIIQQHASDIAFLFPQIRKISDIIPPPRPQELTATEAASRRTRGLQALSTWLQTISNRFPLALICDDTQWGDAESNQFFDDLFAPQSRFHGLLITAVEVSQDSDSKQALSISSCHHSLSQSHPTTLPSRAAGQHSNPSSNTKTRLADSTVDTTHPPQYFPIGLAPLSAAAGHKLLATWTAENNIQIDCEKQHQLIEQSGGNPFLLEELARACITRVLAEKNGHANHSWDPQKALRQRFSCLPLTAENVLQYIAVADRAISFHQLQMVSRIMPNELQHTINFLSSQGWIRSETKRIDAGIEISHDRFRNIILQSLPEERLHRRHYRLARILSSETPPPWARIAYHYWAAERYREAAACYLEAARTALESGAFEDALYFVERALHPDADRSQFEKYKVLRIKAECLAGLGNSRDAAELYDELLEGKQDSIQTPLLSSLAGEQWICAGYLRDGLQRLDTVFGEFGMQSRRRAFGLPRLLSVRSAQLATKSPSALQPVAKHPTDGCNFSDIEQCLNRLAVPLTFLDETIGAELILRLCRRATYCGSKRDQAMAFCRAGILFSFGKLRQRRKSLRWLRIASQLARESREPMALFSNYLCLFVWYNQRGRIKPAMRYALKALKVAQRYPQSMPWEVDFLKWGLLRCHWHRGQLSTLVQEAGNLRDNLIRRTDPMSQFWSNVNAAHWSHLVTGRTDFAKSALDAAASAMQPQQDCFRSPQFFLWLSQVHQQLYDGHPNRAWEILQSEWKQRYGYLLLKTNHYKWMALSARICCCLANAAQQQSQHSTWLTSAARSASLMASLEEPVFVVYSTAYRLVIDAQLGKSINPDQWRQIIQILQRCGHDLFAIAISWHFGIVTEDQQLIDESHESLYRQGCSDPIRLMQLLVPLTTTVHPAIQTNRPHSLSPSKHRQSGNGESDDIVI